MPQIKAMQTHRSADTILKELSSNSCQTIGFKAISTDTEKPFRNLREEKYTCHGSQHKHHYRMQKKWGVSTVVHTSQSTPSTKRSLSHHIAVGGRTQLPTQVPPFFLLDDRYVTEEAARASGSP